jgi:tetratricopeptide (TPR) repeat protein
MADEEKIQTHGFELVLVGIVVFAAIIGSMILSYRFFIIERVKDSEEYNTATYFVVNSETLKEQLLTPMESLRFDDIHVVDYQSYGLCEISFNLILKTGLVQRLKVGLVRVADFWIVYEATLNPDSPAKVPLLSTYQVVIEVLARLEYQDMSMARAYLNLLKKDLRDPNLYDYLSARVSIAENNDVYAAQLLDDLQERVAYGKLSVIFERGMIDFSKEDFNAALIAFHEVQSQYEKELQNKSGEDENAILFSGLPKDPFIASFEHASVYASACQMLALAYHRAQQYDLGLEWSLKAIEQADKIKSKIVRSTALYVKALNLYSLQRYLEAESAFTDVISDIDNANLSQKAWAYFFKGEITVRLGSQADSLDYYEAAVNLDPTNSVIRKGVIEYLISRNLTGDYEIALGVALRGLDYGVEKEVFRKYLSNLYGRLGMRDKSGSL